MAEITFKISEILDLEAELSGLFSQDKKTKLTEGLLSQDISFATKYTLLDFLEVLLSNKKVIDGVVNEMILKHGTPTEDGNVFVNKFVYELDEEGNQIGNPKVNENFIKFDNDYVELMSKEKIIEVPSIKVSELSSVVTKEVYPIFSKYLVIKD
jgi:hypothetical protein